MYQIYDQPVWHCLAGLWHSMRPRTPCCPPAQPGCFHTLLAQGVSKQDVPWRRERGGARCRESGVRTVFFSRVSSDMLVTWISNMMKFIMILQGLWALNCNEADKTLWSLGAATLTFACLIGRDFLGHHQPFEGSTVCLHLAPGSETLRRTLCDFGV